MVGETIIIIGSRGKLSSVKQVLIFVEERSSLGGYMLDVQRGRPSSLFFSDIKQIKNLLKYGGKKPLQSPEFTKVRRIRSKIMSIPLCY